MFWFDEYGYILDYYYGLSGEFQSNTFDTVICVCLVLNNRRRPWSSYCTRDLPDISGSRKATLKNLYSSKNLTKKTIGWSNLNIDLNKNTGISAKF